MRIALTPYDRTPSRSCRVFFALVALVFTCVYPFIGWVNNPNENVRTYMTMALVEEHTFRIDTIVGRYGWVNDMASVPEPDGGRHLFSRQRAGRELRGGPLLLGDDEARPSPRLRRPHRRVGVPRLAKALAPGDDVRPAPLHHPASVLRLPVWLERWLRETSPDPVLRLSAVAAAGLGTNYLAYSLMFASHAPFAIAAFVSFAIITGERARHPLDPTQRRLSRAFLAGLFAGLVTLLEYHGGVGLGLPRVLRAHDVLAPEPLRDVRSRCGALRRGAHVLPVEVLQAPVHVGPQDEREPAVRPHALAGLRRGRQARLGGLQEHLVQPRHTASSGRARSCGSASSRSRTRSSAGSARSESKRSGARRRSRGR